jgi:hypothetical protein
MSAFTATTTLTMAGLDPATQCSRSEQQRVFSLADARWLGGRLKGGHGEKG